MSCFITLHDGAHEHLRFPKSRMTTIWSSLPCDNGLCATNRTFNHEKLNIEKEQIHTHDCFGAASRKG
jgi:hypothetical protein